MTTYTGNSAYCYSNSLHMCVTHAGMASVPGVDLLECMTGMPFGAALVKRGTPMFFPSPAGRTPDHGLTRALETLGWTCDVFRFEDAVTAEGALRAALPRGPALIGPLDMGGLSYDPARAYKRGADHFIVALNLAGDLLQVHDPQSYPFAVLPVADLMRTWNAKTFGPAPGAYTFRCDFRMGRSVSEEEMLAEILKTARDVVATAPAGPVAYGGAAAFTRAAEVLRNQPPDAFTGLLVHFGLPLGARRCVDAAGFFKRVGRSEATRLMVGKAEVFGRAQYHATQGEWTRTAECFDHLSSLEAQIAEAI